MDRWTEVEPILDAALAHAPDDRAAFIAEACAGDDALRREVESLLAQEAAADGLLSTPGFVMAADSLVPRQILGRAVGPYTIQSLLGAGGMGEVYRARDSQLDRDVAIKILPPAFANDSERLVRFAREAKTLAALNHPHIAGIYGLEYIDGVPALVLELVEGQTLAERLAAGPLPLRDAVGIARQIAEALEAAHGRDIIHRDLKPANITVTDAGSVKLLDFGLAKGLQDSETRDPSGSGSSSLMTSSPGALLGTAAYMSPEQATGQAVDSRSDLFSFGAVLYEMLTGRPAFTGETLQQVLDAILTQQPLSPRTINRAIPRTIDRLVMRLLAKDRASRYQAARAVGIELQRLARDLEPGSHSARRRWIERGVAASLLVVLGAVAWIWWQAPSGAAPVEREYTQITHFADSATWPALSSDGRLLTFIRGESTFVGAGQVYVKALPDGEPVRLTSDHLPKMSPAFSPDGSRIAYTTSINNFVWDTWVVGVRDQAPRFWLRNAAGLSWFPDRRLVYSEITHGLHMKVVTATEGQTDVRPAYAPSSTLGMAHTSSVSPDGAWLLITEMDSGAWQPCRLVPADGSTSGRPVGPAGQCTSAAWSPDGNWMYLSSNSSGNFHIWRQRFPDGVPEQVTDGPTHEEGIAVAPDGQSLLTSLGDRHSSIWLRDARGEREISHEGYAFIPTVPNNGAAQPVSPDGRSVFYLVRRGAIRFKGVRERVGELWAADVATGASKPIVTNHRVTGYDISHDGTQLVFAALDDAGVSHVWSMRLDRRDRPRQLATPDMDSPRFSRAGDIYCRGSENGQYFVYRLRPGRPPERALSEPIVFFLTVSPDADWIVAKVAQDLQRESGNLINKAFPTAAGRAPVPLCHACEIDWTSDGRSLVLRLERGFDSPDPATLIMPLPTGESMLTFPGEFQTKTELAGMPIAQELKGWTYPGANGSLQVFARVTTQRNIYRISLR